MRDLENNIMKSVKINRDELLQIVRDNKQKHIQEYNEAVEDYIVLVEKIYQDNLKLAETKDLQQFEKIRHRPQAPTSYEDSYVRAIRMLELSTEEIIEVDSLTFNQLVLDEWQWKQQFTTLSSSYKTN